MSVDECVTKHTHRQYRAWLDWLEQQWNVPSRTDWYLMKIMSVFERRKDGDLTTYKIPFKTGKETKEDKMRRAQRSKAIWGSILSAAKPTRLLKGNQNARRL